MAHSKPGSFGPSPLLVHVARAIAQHAGDAIAAGDHYAALTELASLVMVSVPARGVIATDDLRHQIDRIADRHLRRRAAEKQFVAAIERVKSKHTRDAIDAAHLQLVELSELAHYYAGLTSGLTLADLGRR